MRHVSLDSCKAKLLSLVIGLRGELLRKNIPQTTQDGRHTEANSPYVSSTSRAQSSTAFCDCSWVSSCGIKKARLEAAVNLLETLKFAARDYLRISRAATDTTGASLTMWKVEIECKSKEAE